MKINSISTTKKNINFSAGKVHVFSDFDETFLPEGHKNFAKNQDYRMVNSLREYFANFRDFLHRTKDDLKFTITTGRTYAEFETMAEISRERCFGMPLPDTLICKNGSDEYLKIGTDEDFYRGGFFPFDYEQPNPIKEAKIKELTGWDGKQIKAKLTELFKEHDFQIVEAGSEHGASDYGWRSLFNNTNLDKNNPNEWKIGFRKDGNCKIYFTLPADMYKNPERRDVADDVFKKLHDFFSEKSMKVHFNATHNSSECGGRYCFSIEPKVNEHLWQHVSSEFDKGLTKFFDTQQAVARAKLTNDLVVIAGDSSNDRIMLNPVNYMIDELKKRNISTEDINGNVPQTLIKFLKRHPSLYKIYKNLPFMCVIEKHLKDSLYAENTDLTDLIECFSKGKYQKIVVVENGKLEEGIKEAIRLYAQQNKEYKGALSSNLSKEIINQATESFKKVQKTIATGVILGLCTLGVAGGYKYFSEQNTEKDTQKTVLNA